jgi:hypothetical protein
MPESAPSEEAEPPEAPAELWPFHLDSLVLRDVRARVVDPAIDAAPAEFALAALSLGDLALEDGALSLGAFGIREPRLQVTREFAEGLAGAPGPAAPAETAPPTGSAAPLRYRVERIDLEGAGLTLQVDGRSLDVGFAVEADGATLRGGPFPAKVRLDIEDGHVELEGSVGLQPTVFQGRLRWSDLPVPLAVLAVSPDLVSWLRSCRAHGDLEIELRAEQGPGGEPALLRAGGEASVEPLELASPGDDEEILLAWKRLSVALREAVVPLAPEAGEPVRVALASVRLVEPRMLYTNPAASLEELLASDATEATSAPVEETPADAAPVPIELEVDLLEVVDADARFVDRAVDYRARVRDLDVLLEGLRWPGPRLANARVTARPPRGRKISLVGSLDGRSGALELDLEELALPPLNAYSEPAGYRLGAGHATLHTTLSSDGSVLDARNTIELHQLDVHALHPEDFRTRFGMPLDLTLALLRDSQQKISLSVPVVVGLDGGSTRVGLRSILQSALRQALVGAATSPLKMGGFALSALGVGGSASEPLPSVPGQSILVEGHEDRIAATAVLLSSRPGLDIELRGLSGPSDGPPLAEAMLIERLEAGDGLPDVEDAGLLARRRVASALRARGRGEPGELDDGDRALLGRYVAVVEVPPERLAALARLRAETVRDALVADGVDAARLTVGETGSGDPGVLLELTSAP